MTQKIVKSSGWVLTIVLGLLFALSAFLKLTQNETALAQATSLGIEPDTYRLLGAVEIFSLILFLIPRTGLVGSLLLVAYMGGAIASHLQHHQSITVAITVQVLLWVTVAMRFPQIFPNWSSANNGNSESKNRTTFKSNS